MLISIESHVPCVSHQNNTFLPDLMEKCQPKCVMHIIWKVHPFSFIIILYLFMRQTKTSAMKTKFQWSGIIAWMDWNVFLPTFYPKCYIFSWFRNGGTVRCIILWGRPAPRITERVDLIKDRALFNFYKNTTWKLHFAITKDFSISKG